MSELNHIINIYPNRFMPKKEHFIIENIKCPFCNGNKVYIHQCSKDEYIEEKCSFCEGEGKIKAKIDVSWFPDVK